MKALWWTFNSFGILTLCNHVAVITMSQDWWITLMPSFQPKEYGRNCGRTHNLHLHLIMSTLFQPLGHNTISNQYLLFLVISSLNCMFAVIYDVPPYIYQYINPEWKKMWSMINKYKKCFKLVNKKSGNIQKSEHNETEAEKVHWQSLKQRYLGYPWLESQKNQEKIFLWIVIPFKFQKTY